MNVVPLEDAEQIAFVNWLELQSLKFTAVPNSTYTKSWNQKRKNYTVGLRSGFADLIILIPPTKSRDGLGYMLCIEMKRIKGGVQSKEQKDWDKAVQSLESPHMQYYLAKGADAAIAVVSHYLKSVDKSVF